MKPNLVILLFEYNWKIREKCFKWCEAISEEELMKERNGRLQRDIANIISYC